MVVSILKNTFVGGEWDKSLYERSDLSKYYTACKTMENFIIQPQGGATKRAGTKFISKVKYISNTAKQERRLVKFSFSSTESYMLEFGDKYIRFYYEEGQLNLSTTPPTYNSGTTYSKMDYVVYNGINYYSRVDSNLGNQPDISTTQWYALESNIVEIPTVFTSSMVKDICYTQSADVLFITHPDVPPQELRRYGVDKWLIQDMLFGATIDAPINLAMTGSTDEFAVSTISADDGSESELSTSTTGDKGNTLTWDAVSGKLYYKVYQISNGVAFYLGMAKTESYEIKVNDEPDLNTVAPEVNNIFNSVNNYPAICSFYQQRLILGMTNNKPQTFWGSVTGAYRNFNRSLIPKDDDSYEFTIASGEINRITGFTPLTDLIITTSGAEWIANSGTNSSITSHNINISPQSRFGSNNLKPLIIGNSVLFVELKGTVVRSLLFSYDIAGFKGSEITLLSRHLFRDKNIVSWCYQGHPNKIIWSVRDDGVLLGLSYDVDNEIISWHHHTTKGSFYDVESILNIDNEPIVYAIVEREINGVVGKYIEVLQTPIASSVVEDCFYVDCGLKYDIPKDISDIVLTTPVRITSNSHGFANGDRVDLSDVEGTSGLNGKQYLIGNITTNTFDLYDINTGNPIDGNLYNSYKKNGVCRKAITHISGLTHLEGEVVDVLANGNIVDGLTVSGGQITLPSHSSRVVIGLNYIANLIPLDFININIDMQDKLKQIKTVLIELEDSRDLKIGTNKDNLLEVDFREGGYYYTATPLYTGVKELNLLDDILRNSSVLMRSDKCLPLTILSITARLNYGGR